MRALRWCLVVALAWVAAGCRTSTAAPPAAAPPEVSLRVFVPPVESEPTALPPSGRRFSSRLVEQVRARLTELGHRLVASRDEAERVLAIGLGLDFHPGGDVKVARLFVRIEGEVAWLDDWARDPLSFYLVPPSQRDLEALAEQIVDRLRATEPRTR